MTPEERTDLRAWMESRFDRIDDKLERETASLSNEIVATRHGTKELIGTLTIQVAELVTVSRGHERELGAINEWRTDGGPLDSRFHRHSERIDEERDWRNTVRGALIAVSVIVPIATGVTTALVVAVLVKALNLKH